MGRRGREFSYQFSGSWLRIDFCLCFVFVAFCIFSLFSVVPSFNCQGGVLFLGGAFPLF